MRWLGASWSVVLLCGLWLGGLTGATGLLLRYKNTPVNEHAAPRSWPADSALHHDPARPTLIMFAHPRCACTQASVGELAVLMARSQGLVSAHVLFYRPSSAPADWARTDLFRTAAAIPGVMVHEDEDGREARHFSSSASGRTLLYSARGELLFEGGITASRGHAGDSVGRDALAALIHDQPAEQTHTPVFGCLIHSDFIPDMQPGCGDKSCKK